MRRFSDVPSKIDNRKVEKRNNDAAVVMTKVRPEESKQESAAEESTNQ